MMRRSAGFHADEARRQLLKEWQNVPALELTANDYITCRVNCVDLKNRLSDIETNCRDRLHVWLLRIVGALNSTHIHGTSVPVEEPSTASKADKAHRTLWRSGRPLRLDQGLPGAPRHHAGRRRGSRRRPGRGMSPLRGRTSAHKHCFRTSLQSANMRL